MGLVLLHDFVTVNFSGVGLFSPRPTSNLEDLPEDLVNSLLQMTAIPKTASNDVLSETRHNIRKISVSCTQPSRKPKRHYRILEIRPPYSVKHGLTLSKLRYKYKHESTVTGAVFGSVILETLLFMLLHNILDCGKCCECGTEFIMYAFAYF